MRRDLETRLGSDVTRARDLLLPLAFAQGQGLPWEDIWAPLASRISGARYTDDDLLWLRRNAGSYIVENTDHNRSAYRLYHQALVEHLRDGADHHAIHDAFVTVLLDRIPLSPDARTDWTRAHPYTRNHLATHATGARRVDEIITDPDYLVHANPDTLLPALQHITTDAAALTRAIYRNTQHHTLTPRQRRHTLALGAARFGDTLLSSELARTLTWRPRWATGLQTSRAHRATLTGHTGAVNAVACAEVDGHPILVTGSHDNTVRVWDLADGTLRATLTGHTDAVLAVACAEIEGRPILVTGSHDNTVRVWDLIDGTLRATLTGHTDAVLAVACAEIEGRPIAITASKEGTVRMWDLADGTLRATLTGHTDAVLAVACAEIGGRPIAVTGSTDRTVRVWDLADGTLHATLTGHTGPVTAVACAEIGGHPIAVTGSTDGTTRMWDLAAQTGDIFFRQGAVAAVTIYANAEIVTAIGWDLAVHHRVDRRLDR